MNLLCRLRHRWVYAADPQTRYGKGGLLLGHVETSTRTCSRCSRTEEIFRYSSLINLCADDTGWLPYQTPAIRESVFNDFLPMAELTAWRRARDEAQVAAAVGTKCERCTRGVLKFTVSKPSVIGNVRTGAYCSSCWTWSKWYEDFDPVISEAYLDRMYPDRHSRKAR